MSLFSLPHPACAPDQPFRDPRPAPRPAVQYAWFCLPILCGGHILSRVAASRCCFGWEGDAAGNRAKRETARDCCCRGAHQPGRRNDADRAHRHARLVQIPVDLLILCRASGRRSARCSGTMNGRQRWR